MRRFTVLLLITLFGAVGVFAQELWKPRVVKQAYAAGFRSMDGKPGPKYFQNKSKHHINISVNPPSRRVTGSQTIEYKNNSPIPLQVLVLRFELNVHSPSAMRERFLSDAELGAEVQIDEYAENGEVRPWNPLIKEKGSTFNAIVLKKPLMPGGTTTLSFKWHYDLVKGTGRQGAISDRTFYLAYFYPRIAVFDDVNDWDQIPHMLSHEFYGEFNDYVVEVTVPKNFIVWGTGNLTNIDEVLQPAYAEKLKRSFTSDEKISIATPQETGSGRVTAQTSKVTWKWQADYVPDVAYGISDRYQWDASSMIVDKKTGRRASTQAAYDLESKNFANMVSYIKTALEYSSFDLPGVPYPYPKMTIFRGEADMEYPMMANDSAQDDPKLQKFIAGHEILHTYFPFYMGINERRYSFMEEGWTTAFEYPFSVKENGREFADMLFKQFRVSGWANSRNPGADIPIITAEDSLTGEAYGNNKYGRSAIGYLALRDLLGEDEFKKALRVFIDRWNGKHPTPWDMFYTFNDATGKNLNWFWNAWFFQPNYIDLAISNVDIEGEDVSFIVKNLGGMPAPFDIVIELENGNQVSIHKTPAVFEEHLKEARIEVRGVGRVKKIGLDGGIWMDAGPDDNSWEAKELIARPNSNYVRSNH